MRKKLRAGGLPQEIACHATESPFAEFSVTISASDDEIQYFFGGERVELGRRLLEQWLAPTGGVHTMTCKPGGDIFDTALGRLRFMILVDLRDDGFLA